MILKKNFLLTISFLITTCLLAQEKQVDVYNLSKEFLLRGKEIHSLSFQLTKKERLLNGDYKEEQVRTKTTKEPFRVYTNLIQKDKSPELIYKTGWNDGKVLINPDGFPWINLSFDPRGDFMRKDQHHTVLNTGYTYAMSVLQHLFDKYGEEVKEMGRYLGSETRGAHDCWVFEFVNKYYKYEDYTVQENEDVVDIAERNMLSEFKILEYNEDIDNYNDIKPGQVIKVPNDYCPKMIISVDKKRFIPLAIKIFDEKGLFEQYQYDNVVVNPMLTDQDFSTSNPNYGF